MTLRRNWLAAAAVAVLLSFGSKLPAQDAATPASDAKLHNELTRIHHTITTLGDYRTATGLINGLLGSNPKPVDVITIINNSMVLSSETSGLVASLNKVTDPKWSPRSDVETQFKQAARQLSDFIERGMKESITPEVIQVEIERLNRGPFPQQLARERLKRMSPFCVPLMIEVIRDDVQADLRPGVVWCLPHLGRSAVDPICVALDAPDEVPAKLTLVGILAQMGYPHAIPYIQALGEGTKSPELQAACKDAVSALHKSPARAMQYSGTSGRMFSVLGDNYYSDEPSLRPLKDTFLPVWRFDPKVGVRSARVPSPIYNEVMAMQCFERALKLDKDQPDTISLWIAANIRREAELAQLAAEAAAAGQAGPTDPLHPADQPNAQYWAVLHGPNYLLRAMQRSCADRDSAVTYGLAEALGVVGFGDAVGAEVSVLSNGLLFPDLRVRTLLASIMAGSAATSALPGAASVAPTLAEAIGQTGGKFAVCLAPDGDETKALLDQVRQAGFKAEAFASRQAVLDWSRSPSVPRVDLLVLHWQHTEGGVKALAELRRDHRFANAPIIVVSLAPMATRDELRETRGVAVTPVTVQAAEIGEKVVQMQSDIGGKPLTDEEATRYAVMAAGALAKMAARPPAGMDVSAAVPAMMRALKDSRLELAVACSQALANANSAAVQRALAQAAGDAAAEPQRRAAFYAALAVSARQYGNMLTDTQVDAVVKTATTDPTLAVRHAAAKATGALNLPAAKIETPIGKALPPVTAPPAE